MAAGAVDIIRSGCSLLETRIVCVLLARCTSSVQGGKVQALQGGLSGVGCKCTHDRSHQPLHDIASSRSLRLACGMKRLPCVPDSFTN